LKSSAGDIAPGIERKLQDGKVQDVNLVSPSNLSPIATDKRKKSEGIL